MPETLEDLIMLRPPTAERPLLGSIVLVVEDSRHTCEVLRLICQRSGARIRRAEGLTSAHRHLRAYRPRIAVIDLGLPDGSGLDLIDELARAEPRIDALIAMSGDDTLHSAAMEAGADIFLPKPLASVSQFQNIALGLMPEALRPPSVVTPLHDTVEPDPIALRDDLSLAADLLRQGPDGQTLDYLGAFLASLGKDSGLDGLQRLAAGVREIRAKTPGAPDIDTLADEVENRLHALQTV